MLIGRDTECARIDDLLARARAGSSGALVFRGEPGIGKSALLEHALQRSAGMHALRAVGVHAESDIPFAALHELLRPVLDRIDQIPAQQADALKTALALGGSTSPERFAVAAATLSLLAAAAEERPTLCLIDDAQWLDAASAEALVFACRRLSAEGIVMLFAARSEGRREFVASTIPTHDLVGLGAADARTLLAREGVKAEAMAPLLDAARGNPLALRELPSQLGRPGPTQLRDDLAAPLPVGARIEQAFLERTRALPAETQRALIVVAASDSPEMVPLAVALEALDSSARALEAAESAGVIDLIGGQCAFRHPLVRSAVYHAAQPVERRAAHRSLAGAFAASGDRTRAAWHLAASAIGSDEAAAVALEDSAGEAIGRGGHTSAGRALERAASLTAPSPARTRRLAAAGEAFWAGGQPAVARPLLDAALAASDDPRTRADVQRLRGRIAGWTGNVIEAYQLLTSEGALIEPVDRGRAALLSVEAAVICFMSGDVRLGRRTSEHARDLAESIGGPPTVVAAAMMGHAYVLSGETERGRAALDHAAEALLQADLIRPALVIAQVAYDLVWIEEFDRARQILIAVIGAARAQSAVTVLPFALATLAELDFRTGALDAAYAGASESITLADLTGERTLAAFSYVTLARVEAMLGREEDCRAHAAAALELAERLGAGSIRLYAASALALNELGAGRPEPARALLEPMTELVEQFGLGEPAAVQWAPDLIESLAQLGRRSEAHEILRRLEQEAQSTGRTWAHAAAARGRGLLADEHEFPDVFDEALRWHDRRPTPFERARTEFAYGGRLRRAGQRRAARERLRSALGEFERIGARPWADRARSELRASGERLRRREDDAREELTAQELHVALVVARGATNKEAAEQLFLSPKTIEFHLGHVYRKLGMRSRADLARRFALDPSLATSHARAGTDVREATKS